jgi:hypothetical protein
MGRFPTFRPVGEYWSFGDSGLTRRRGGGTKSDVGDAPALLLVVGEYEYAGEFERLKDAWGMLLVSI